MALVFTNVGEFHRGKGNRGARFGPRMRLGADDRTGGKKAQAPDKIATDKLFKLLDKPGMMLDDRKAYRNLMLGAEQVRFMNMDVLAQAILYIHQHGWELTCQAYNPGDPANRDRFNYTNILDYVEPLIDRQFGNDKVKATEDELNIIRLRLAATMFRYIVYVRGVKEQANLELTRNPQQPETIGEVI